MFPPGGTTFNPWPLSPILVSRLGFPHQLERALFLRVNQGNEALLNTVRFSGKTQIASGQLYVRVSDA